MPKFVCKCGEWIQYGQIPTPNEWLIISDEKYDKFSGMVDTEELYLATDSMLRCPSCERLWVFWNGFGQPPESFVSENGGDEVTRLNNLEL